jgi:hypothetical protein
MIKTVSFNHKTQIIYSVDDMRKSNMTYARDHILDLEAYERVLFKSRVNCLDKNITQAEADNNAYEHLNAGTLTKANTNNTIQLSQKKMGLSQFALDRKIKSESQNDISGLLDPTAIAQYNSMIKPNLKKYIAPNFDTPQELMEFLTIKPSVIEELKDKPDFLNEISLKHFNKAEFCTTASVLRAMIKAEAKNEYTQILNRLNRKPQLTHSFEYRKLTMDLNKAKHTRSIFKSFNFAYINAAVEKHGWSQE